MSAPIALTERPDDLYSMRTLEEMGLGSRRTNLELIRQGRLPAVLVGNAYKVRARDLHLLAKPVGPAPTPAVSVDELAVIAAKVVSTWPRLSDERKAELGRLLAA